MEGGEAEMFEGPVEWIHVFVFAVGLMIFLARCNISLIAKVGQRLMNVANNADSIAVCKTCPSQRTCTAQDMELLGGILSEYPSNRDDSWVCPICLCDDSQSHGKELREFKSCKHVYHRQCIDRWCLDTPLDSVKCPLCRGPVFEPQIDPSRNSAVAVTSTPPEFLPGHPTLLRPAV